MELPVPHLEPSPRWVRVRAGGEWVAESKRALLEAWYGPDMDRLEAIVAALPEAKLVD